MDSEGDLGRSWDAQLSRLDDATWARVNRLLADGRLRFSWQLFTMWWIARRWVLPRDVRRSLPPRIVDRYE